MGGFPGRPGLDAFGPTMINTGAVRDPSRQLSASTWNLARWQLAGLGLVAFRAHLIFLADDDAQTIRYRAEAWNPEARTTGAHAPPTITRIATGNYDVVYPTPVPDFDGASVSLSFRHGLGAVVTPSQVNFRHVMVTPLSGNAAGVKVRVLDSSGNAHDGHDVSILIG